MIDRFHHLFIRARDFEASLAFYRDVIGWEVIHTWGGDGRPRGAVLSGRGMEVVVAESALVSEVGRPEVHLDIHDVDARFQRMPKGAHVVREPEATGWGTRWFVVRDPDGNLIAFEQVHGS